MGFANQNLNEILSNPPQEKDDGSFVKKIFVKKTMDFLSKRSFVKKIFDVKKTMDWDLRDLKVKSKCASSFRLSYRPA